jgi:hypothetical protein
MINDEHMPGGQWPGRRDFRSDGERASSVAGHQNRAPVHSGADMTGICPLDETHGRATLLMLVRGKSCPGSCGAAIKLSVLLTSDIGARACHLG